MPPLYDKRVLRQEVEDFSGMKGRSWTPIVPVVAAILAKVDAPEIVDLGMGCGFLGRCLRKLGYRGRIIGYEVHEPYMGQPWHSEYDQALVKDITELWLDEKSVVALIEVLEHLVPSKAAAVLSQINRGIISTPLDPGEQGSINGNEFERHVRFYNADYLASFGFRCISVYDVPQADHTMKRGALYVKGMEINDVDPEELGPDWMIAGRPQRQDEGRTTLCLVMMVKNEARVIEGALASAKPYIEDFVITDTGSTDGTQAVIEAWGKRNQIPGKVIQSEWFDNWGKNRTEMFWNAQMNSSSDFGFILDADDALVERAPFLPQFLKADAYRIRMLKAGTSWRRPDVLKMQHVWWWEGADHPGLMSSTQIGVGDLDWEVRAYPDGARTAEQTRPWEKYIRGADALQTDLAKNPGNTRALFYFAQNLRDAGLAALEERDRALETGNTLEAAKCAQHAKTWFEASLVAYQQRIQLGGFEEERWFSMWQVGCLLEELGRDIEVPATMLAAYELRPTRAEPLVNLAEHYRCRGWHRLALMVAHEAWTIKYPKDDVLPVQDDCYEWQAWFEFLHAMLKLGTVYETFEKATGLTIGEGWDHPTCLIGNVWHKFPEDAKAELLRLWPEAPNRMVTL